MNDENSDPGRQSNGQFAKGNPGGHGSAASGKARHWRKLLEDATTDEKLLAVWEGICNAAQGGDMKAAQLFMERLLGKAVQSMEITGGDGGPVTVSWTFGSPIPPGKDGA
jgi:hypothetical protein